MEKKSYAKRYLVSIFGLYFFGAILLLGVAYLLSIHPGAKAALNLQQMLMISLLCPLIPCGSYAGFCVSMIRIKEFNRAWIIALCVFFPITLAVITVFGIVMIIPSIIKQAYILIKN